MDWSFLSFLAQSWFVIPWYAVGVLGCAFVIWDEHANNTPLKQAMKWAWPIIVLFFSVIGLALYFATARAPGISHKEGEEAQKAHDRYEENMFRRVNGAVIHCVAGDGIGIMSGMVIARAVRMNSWQEFWFEYVVGFLCGWLVFQLKSMTMMTDSKVKALAMAFRGEFFSMLTVMGGMGAVMLYVTPLAVTQQPRPLTYAFWGFGMLGLIVGYVLTFPMNWMMVKIGWKHGMGSMESAKPHQLKATGPKVGVFATMVVLGIAALVLPAWLVTVRNGRAVSPSMEASGIGGSGRSKLVTLAEGARTSIGIALQSFGRDGTRSALAIDAAMRVAEVGEQAAPESAFKPALQAIQSARHDVHMGDGDGAQRNLQRASQLLERVQPGAEVAANPNAYDGATVVNAHGAHIGEVTGVHGDQVELTLGHADDVWGFWDFSSTQKLQVPARELVFGPHHTVGYTLVALPTQQTPPLKGVE